MTWTNREKKAEASTSLKQSLRVNINKLISSEFDCQCYKILLEQAYVGEDLFKEKKVFFGIYFFSSPHNDNAY
jgi:hypothetical protein